MSKQNVEKKVLEYLLKIPKGKVVTYKILAEKFGVHPRKISQIMKNNTSPEKYPCYKVISHWWTLGGYNNGGEEEKKKKLISDWVVIKNGKVSHKYYYLEEQTKSKKNSGWKRKKHAWKSKKKNQVTFQRRMTEYVFLIIAVALIFVAFLAFQKSYFYEKKICSETQWYWNENYHVCQHGFLYLNPSKKDS